MSPTPAMSASDDRCHARDTISDEPEMRRARELLATHDGKLPPHVPDLAALIGFALVADFERVADKTWLPPP